MNLDLPIERPILIILAGPNGAGKSTFYQSFLEPLALYFVNADLIALELGIDAYMAARVAESLREYLVRNRQSFIFETVFSDPVGNKLDFFKEAVSSGFTVVLLFIGISSPDVSSERVTFRRLMGGHDVPADKLTTRFPRTLENLRRSIEQLPLVMVFDNDDLNDPYRLVATFASGQLKDSTPPLPPWLLPLLPRA